MPNKYTADEKYIEHSFGDLEKFTKENGNQILIAYVDAVKDSIITPTEKQYFRIPDEAFLKISSIFDGIPKDNIDIGYFYHWKEELLRYLGRLRAANKSQIKFTIWQCRMNLLKIIEEAVIAENKLSQSYNKDQHKQQELP